jgi:glyoxylase-like metal-dependent hydrolase (beta-lactamase superfamily II)
MRYQLLLFFVVFQMCGAYAQEHSVKILKFSEGLYGISLDGVNLIAMVNNKEALLVDAGMENTAPILQKILDSLGSEKLVYLINTHWHFDHCDGNKIIVSPGTEVIAHPSVKILLESDQQLLGSDFPAYPSFAIPKTLVEDKRTLLFHGSEVVITAYPGGHSGGDVVVWFTEDKLLHVGDMFFADIFPFVDTDHGGNVFVMLYQLKRLTKDYPKGTVIMPGHGRLYTMKDLKKYISDLTRCTLIIKKHLENGKTVDEILATGDLKDWEGMGKAFSLKDWIEFVQKSLPAK